MLGKKFRRIGLALLLALPALPVAAAAKPDIRLYAMDCGRLTMANADGYADDGSYKGKPASMVVPCYLIRHPKGDLVWDTGVPQWIADNPGGTLPGGITVSRKLTDQLKQLNLTPPTSSTSQSRTAMSTISAMPACLPPAPGSLIPMNAPMHFAPAHEPT